jgi:hypothetical protein
MDKYVSRLRTSRWRCLSAWYKLAITSGGRKKSPCVIIIQHWHFWVVMITSEIVRLSDRSTNSFFPEDKEIIQPDTITKWLWYSLCREIVPQINRMLHLYDNLWKQTSSTTVAVSCFSSWVAEWIRSSAKRSKQHTLMNRIRHTSFHIYIHLTSHMNK